MGFLFLSFLPTTISTAIGLTTMAEGNISGSLFNCTLAAVIGVFLVPLYSLLFMQVRNTGEEISLVTTIGNVAVTMILPLLLGQAFRPTLIKGYEKYKRSVKQFNNGIILFIVWTAFCASFVQKVWERVSGVDLSICISGSLLLLGVASGALWKISAVMNLDTASRITAFYCGSQKSLAIGLPMSAIIFGRDNPSVDLSLVVIPLLIYHPAQMILGGWLAPKFANRIQREEANA